MVFYICIDEEYLDKVAKRQYLKHVYGEYLMHTLR